MATNTDVLALVAMVQALKDAIIADTANKSAASAEITAAIKEITDLLAAKQGNVLTADDVAAIQQATADVQAAATRAATPIELPPLPPETGTPATTA